MISKRKSNLVGYWKLNGTNKDYSVLGNNGTWTGESYTNGFNNHLFGNFTGTNYMRIIGIGSYTNITSEFSISVWFNVTDANVLGVLYSSTASLSSRFSMRVSNSELKCGMYNGADSIGVSSGALTNGWHHAVYTFNGSSTGTLYIDGVRQTGTNAPAYGSDIASYIGIRTDLTQGFTGQIGEFRVYNKILTNDEILELYKMSYPEINTTEFPIDTLPDTSDTSLKGAWLNKKVSNTANDLSSNAVNASSVTDIVYDKVGANFNGSTSKINCGTSATICPTTTFTFSAWAKFNSVSANQSIISRWDNPADENAYQFWLYGPDGKLYFDISPDGDTISETPAGTYALTTEKWYHTVAVYNGSTVKIYIDGVVYSSLNYSSGMFNSTNATFIGGSGNTGTSLPLNGTLKDVRVYSEAKDLNWIKNEYQKGNPDNSLVFQTMSGMKDLSKNKTTITNSGTIVGKDMLFSGSSYLNCGTSSAFNLTGTMTISFWMKTTSTSTTYMRLVAKGETGTNYAFRVFFRGSEDGLFFGTTNGYKFKSTAGLNNNTWHHIVCTYDNSGAFTGYIIYIDGVLQTGTSTSGDAGFLNSSEPLTIGAYSDDSVIGSYFIGSMKDVKIFNETKTGNWVKQYYDRTKKYY
jgi:hypothetical protein